MRGAILGLLLTTAFHGLAQDLHYARSTIELLSGAELKGRGYVGDGHKKAADYIANEFRQFGLQSYALDYQQRFPLSVNTFPGKVSVRLDNKKLRPGVDFIVAPNSPGIKGTYQAKTIQLDTLLSDLSSWVKYFKRTDKALIIHKTGYQALAGEDRQVVDDVIDVIKYNRELTIPALIVVDSTKLTWGVSTQLGTRPVIYVRGQSIGMEASKVNFNIQNNYLDNEFSQNVIGLVEGHRNDSIMVVSAHYDHLGSMGKDTYFPGANDNASGIAMLLSLARHYSFFEKPPFDVLFIAFGGEEAGLLGSTYYTGRPVYPLHRIKFLINLDMVGTGDEGIKVVNGKVHRQQFDQLLTINQEQQLLPVIGARGSACNSDHCPFDRLNVPGFFIYTLGGIQAYHDIYDQSDTLPLTEFEDLFLLLKEFIARLK